MLTWYDHSSSFYEPNNTDKGGLCSVCDSHSSHPSGSQYPGRASNQRRWDPTAV